VRTKNSEDSSGAYDKEYNISITINRQREYERGRKKDKIREVEKERKKNEERILWIELEDASLVSPSKPIL